MKIILSDLPTEPDCVSFYKNSIAFRSLLRMCDANATAGQQVAYLLGKEKEEQDWTVYGWFSLNRKNPQSTLVLPEPTDPADRLALPTTRRAAGTGVSQTVLTQEKLNEQLKKEQVEIAVASEFQRAVLRYPVGNVVDVPVKHVTRKQNRSRLFFDLDDVPFQVTAEFTPGKKSKYWEGKVVKLRITGTGKNKDDYPNFVAEIVK